MPEPNHRVRDFFQTLIGSKSKEEILAHEIPMPKTDSEDYYTSFEKRGQSKNGSHEHDEKMAARTKPGSYVHRSKIIVERAYFISDPQHRNIVHYFNAFAGAVRKKIPEHLTEERPLFCKPGTEKEEEPEEMENIIAFWEDNRMQEILCKSISKSFVHGWINYYPLNLTEYEKKWYTGLPAYIISSDEAKPYKWIKGHPVAWEVKPTNKEVEPYFPNIMNSRFFDYTNSDDFDGEPYLINSWDDIIDLTFMKDAVNAFDQRFGNGFLVLVVPNNTDDTEIEQHQEKIRNVRTSRGLVVRGDVDEPVVVDWMGMGGTQVDFIGHMDKIEDHIALDMGYPKKWLFGDAAGALASAEEDGLQIMIKSKSLFKKFIPYIKILLKYHGIIKKDSDVIIKPPFTMHMSKQQEIELESIKTQTIAQKTWLSVNEQRELDGGVPTSEEGADEVMVQEPEADNTDYTDNTDKPANNEDKSDAYDLIEQLFAGSPSSISANKLASFLGISPTTVSKAIQNVALQQAPQFKMDSIKCKCDSVAIGEDLYKVEDVPLVLSQEKAYGDKWCVRSAEEVERVWNDPRTPKQFRIGVSPDDLHTSRVPLEVLDDMAIGRTEFKRFEDGQIRGDIIYDLKATDRILGPNNWVREMLTNNENPNTSVALYTKDRPEGDKYIESNLDIRSFVATRKPRNTEAGR